LEANKPWRLCLFGQPRILGEQTIDSFATRRSALLLARLALAKDFTLTRAAAADILWPDDFYDATRIRLRQELTRLRKSLGAAKEIIQTDDEKICLSEELLSVDLREFEILFKRQLQLTGAEKRAALREAVALSQDTFMPGEIDAWVELERGRLSDLRYAVLTELAHELLRENSYEESLSLARQAIAVNQFREDAHLIAMQALGNLGFFSDALSQYQWLRRLLSERQTQPSAEAETVAASLHAKSAKISITEQAESKFAFPTSADRLFGRDGELKEIQDRLHPDSSDKILTLLGPGGIGKTRLALEAGQQLADIYQGHLGYVGLADLEDVTLLPSTLLSSLFPAYDQTQQPLEQLVEALPGYPFLLVFDNLEQLLPEGALVFAELLAKKPELKILCTSRQALNIAGETILRISGLAVAQENASPNEAMNSPAVQMFEAAARSNTNQNWTEDDKRIVLDVVRKLEGIPLALQIAAARLRTLTLRELDAQLEKRFDLLVNRRVDAPDRHKTLLRAIQSSYESLNPSLRKAFVGLSIFRGGWTRTSAEVVCELDNCLDVLEELLDASLIQVEEGERTIRFRMMETLREFAVSELTEESGLALARRHAQWILDLVTPASSLYAGLEAIDIFKQLDSERDNIREACRFALDHDLDLAFELGAALGSYWYYRTLAFEAEHFYEELFAKLGNKPLTPAIVRASLANAEMAHSVRDDRRKEIIERTIRFAHELGMRREESLATTLQALYLLRGPVHADSVVLSQHAAELISDSGSELDRAYVARMAMLLSAIQGSPDSIAVGRQILETARKHQATYLDIRARQFLAFAALHLGELDVARESLAGLMEEARAVGAHYQVTTIHEGSGLLEMYSGNYEAALEHLLAGRDIWTERRVADQIADMDRWIGLCYYRKGDLDKAAENMTKSLEFWVRTEHLGLQLDCLVVFALIWLVRGDRERAAKILGVCERITAEKDLVRSREQMSLVQDVLEQTGPVTDVEHIPLERAIDLALGKEALSVKH